MAVTTKTTSTIPAPLPSSQMGFGRLAKSSKAYISVLVIFIISLFAFFGKISYEKATEYIVYVAVTWLGSIGLEDAAQKFGIPPNLVKTIETLVTEATPPPTTEVKTTINLPKGGLLPPDGDNNPFNQ